MVSLRSIYLAMARVASRSDDLFGTRLRCVTNMMFSEKISGPSCGCIIRQRFHRSWRTSKDVVVFFCWYFQPSERDAPPDCGTSHYYSAILQPRDTIHSVCTDHNRRWFVETNENSQNICYRSLFEVKYRMNFICMIQYIMVILSNIFYKCWSVQNSLTIFWLTENVVWVAMEKQQIRISFSF